MAATDKVTVFFTRTGDRFWTNVWHVNSLTMAAAVAWANTTLVPAMASQMGDQFSIVRTVVDHLADDTFETTPLSVPGDVTGDFLPLFNTVKVLFPITGGRPDYKFVRGWLQEASQTDGNVTDAAIAVIADIFDTLITDSNTAGVDLVDTAGSLYTISSVQRAVQMRQLHRRRKKVVVP
jgi:hypothetical protein